MKKKLIIITSIVLVLSLLGSLLFYVHYRNTPHDGELKSAEEMLYDRFGEPHTASNKEIAETRFYNYFEFPLPDAASVYQNGKTVTHTGNSSKIEEIHGMCKRYVSPTFIGLNVRSIDWNTYEKPVTADEMDKTIWHATCVLLIYHQRQKYIADPAETYRTGDSDSRILDGMEYDALLILLAQDGTVQIIPCLDGKYLFDEYSIFKAQVDEETMKNFKKEYEPLFK